MIFESFPDGVQNGASLELDSSDIPVMREVFSHYVTGNQELLADNVNLGFMIHAFLETTKDSHEPVTIGLGYEDSEFFLKIIAHAIRDYVENDLIPFREMLAPEASWSVELKDNEEAPESPTPELDEKIEIAARLAMDFEELAGVNSRDMIILQNL